MRIRFQAEMDRITAIELGRWGIVEEDDDNDYEDGSGDGEDGEGEEEEDEDMDGE